MAHNPYRLPAAKARKGDLLVSTRPRHPPVPARARRQAVSHHAAGSTAVTRESNPSHSCRIATLFAGQVPPTTAVADDQWAPDGHSPKRSKEWVCLVDLHLSQPPLGVTWLAKVATYLAGLARAPQMDSFRTKEAFRKGPLLLRRQSSAVNASAHVSFR